MPRPATHPSYYAYSRGCHCDGCRALNAARSAEYRARQRAAGWVYRKGRRVRPSPNPPGGRRLYDQAEIARVACEAYADGLSMRVMVAARFGITANHAATQIHLAREAGHDIPRRGQTR